MSTTDDTATAPRAFENRTLREQVVEHLREEILSSRLRPGTELHEVNLAQSLGVSRGPLREALGRLAAEGLVTIVPRRGAVVTRLTRLEFLECHQVCQALEALAVGLAVPRLSQVDRDRLRILSEELRQLSDTDAPCAVLRAGRAFQDVFVQASRNRRLRELHGQFVAQSDRVLAHAPQLNAELQAGVASHAAILAAVEEEDGERAVRLVEAHAERSTRLLEGLADELFDDVA